MFEKASQIDLSCYDDPEYYNDFVLAVAEAEGSIDRFLAMCNMMMQGLTMKRKMMTKKKPMTTTRKSVL